MKIPRWAAILVLTLWLLSIAETIVAQAISSIANVHYLRSGRNELPPPWPGQPALSGPKDGNDQKDDKGNEQRWLRRR